MSPVDSFKVGFAMRCAEEGLEPLEVQNRLANASELIKRAEGGLSSVLGTGLPLTAIAAAAAPVALGAGLGFAAHHATESDVDADDVRKKELINELRHWTRRAKWQKSMKTLPGA
jgi:hypothetical protein